MKLTVAIHPDDYTGPGKPPESDASSFRWARLLQAAGHDVRWVDVYRPDILAQIQGCDAFMWRWAHFGGMFQIARRLLPVIERELGIPVYPNQNTCWHYDDKIAQAYLFDALRIPSPKTWCWFSGSGAKAWARETTYPLVLKLAGGAGSENVRLIRTIDEANQWIERLFTSGAASLEEPREDPPWTLRKRLRAAAKALLLGKSLDQPSPVAWPLEKQYALFQEFLPDNAYDTRVTVIGGRAFAFRRFNRPDDFRASGSGLIDWNQQDIDKGFLRLAYYVASQLKTQSCAIDGVYDSHRNHVTVEVSYTYVSAAVHECPGHWELEGDPWNGTLSWVEGQMWPEEAQISDLLSNSHFG